VLADSMPLGPRRTAVAKAEVEVLVAQEKLDLAIDNQDWRDAVTALADLQSAREERDRVMKMWILDIPGAEEFFHPKEKASGTS
jgi:hypothetical protein